MVSNTRYLRERGWKGVLIEGNPDFYAQVSKSLGNNTNLFLFENMFQTKWHQSMDLDQILKEIVGPKKLENGL